MRGDHLPWMRGANVAAVVAEGAAHQCVCGAPPAPSVVRSPRPLVTVVVGSGEALFAC